MNKTYLWIIRYLGVWAIALLFISIGTGCTPKTVPAKVRIVWPPYPEKPSLEFIGVYATESDLINFSGWEQFWDLLIGRAAKHEFSRPFGITTDSNGRVYVSDAIQRNIQVFDFDKKTIEYFNTEFHRPMGLAIDQQDHLFIADGDGKCIYVFSSDWKPIKRISKDKILSNPSYIAVNYDLKRIYVSDAPSHKIIVFTYDGDYLFSIGGPGKEDGQFSVPQGLTFDKNNRLYVADMLNSRIQIFDADGKFINKFGVQGIEYWNFENPRDLKFSADNTLYVVDYRKAMLQGYTPTGQITFALGTNSRSSKHQLEFGGPVSLTISTDNKIYIIDSINKRISAWQLL